MVAKSLRNRFQCMKSSNTDFTNQIISKFQQSYFQTMWLLETKTHRDVYPSITNNSKENDEGLATSVFFFDNLFRLSFSWRKLQIWGFFFIK